jgi:hypothetical protein
VRLGRALIDEKSRLETHEDTKTKPNLISDGRELS